MALIAEWDEVHGLTMIETEVSKDSTLRQYAFQPGRPGKTNVRRKRRWTISVSYDTPSGPQELEVKPSRKCYLAQISPDIEAAIREDAKRTGRVTNIRWKATGL